MSHRELECWVDEVAQLTTPSHIHWCDGSVAEADRLNQLMLHNGTFIRLNEEKHPNSFLARSDINDVARVEGQTFICCQNPADAGPTNNWKHPTEIHHKLRDLFRRCMTGRIMYVVPYLMGPAGSPLAKVGVEITDSPYVVANMRIMTRMGNVALDALETVANSLAGCTVSASWIHRSATFVIFPRKT